MTERERRPDVRFRFGRDPTAGRQARRRLEPLLSDPDDVIADDVRLAASEMVTNAVMHTERGGELRAWDPRPAVPLRVEVEDSGDSPPVVIEQPPDGEKPSIGGRGMAIVAAVSDEWGYELTPGGKVVWAEFDRDKRRAVSAETGDATHPDPED